MTTTTPGGSPLAELCSSPPVGHVTADLTSTAPRRADDYREPSRDQAPRMSLQYTDQAGQTSSQRVAFGRGERA